MDAMRKTPLAALAALTVGGGLLAGCMATDVLVPYADPTPTAAIPVSEPIPATPLQMAQPAMTPQASMAPPMQTAQTVQPLQPAPQAAQTVQPVQTAWAFPTVPKSVFGRGESNPGNAMPAEEAQCRKRLQRLGVKYRDIPRIRDSASCGIDWPVEVTSLGRGIKLTPAAKLNCAMAEEAALWAQKDLVPAARTRYLSGVAAVRQMSSYSCRKIAGSRTMSEHSKGNALDIGAIKLKNGRVIVVHRSGLFAFRERSFLRKVRGEACGRFGTVLGPGYNRDHADHFHLDLKERRNVACH
mgnify:CR=1 FL=1